MTITPPKTIWRVGVSSIITQTQKGPKMVSSNSKRLTFAAWVYLVAYVKAAKESGNIINPEIEIAKKSPKKIFVSFNNKAPIRPVNNAPNPVAPIAGMLGLDLNKTKFIPKVDAVIKPQNNPNM